MKHFYVVGNRASKSLSPLIFNHWFKKYNIKAKYSFLEVSEKGFDKMLTKHIKGEKTNGLNITIPFKKNILKHLDIEDAHSKNIGAVNCVTIGKKIKGTNTDWKGYLNSIQKEKIVKNKKIVILGYAGASQAIYYGLKSSGFKNIIVFNRSKKQIKYKGTRKYTKKYTLINGYLNDVALIINTTPTNPLTKKQINIIKKKTIISDIVYKPKHTVFLKKFKENKKIYGISMLIEQAIPCFYQWFGFCPKVDKSLLKKIDKKIK